MKRKTPLYYFGKYKKIESMDVVLDFCDNNYNLGTALTYIMRAGKKPNNPITQDIKKAIVHLEAELEHQIKLQAIKDESGSDYLSVNKTDGESRTHNYPNSPISNIDWWETYSDSKGGTKRKQGSVETASDNPVVG